MDSKISVPVAVAVGLGAIIGAGIFVLSGTAIAIAGGYALLAFLFVGLIVILVALEMGELSSRMPNETGASYSFVFKAFGSELGFITGILLFFSYASSISVISLGFGSYLSSILDLSTIFNIPFAIMLIFVLSLLNILGIKKAAKADSFLVVIKISILVLFIFAALLISFSHHIFSVENFSKPNGNILIALFSASVAIFFAYSGFQTISTFTSKIKGRNGVAKAILIATLASLVLYVFVVFALISLVPASSYRINADPLSFALSKSGAPNWLFILVDIGALIATTSASIAMILSSSRVLYQMGKDRLLPKLFREYNNKSDVAMNGVIFSATVGVVMLFSGNIYVMAAISNFGLIFSYLMTSFAFLHFRKKGSPASFMAPFYPYLPVLSIFLLFVLMLGMPKISLIIGVIMIILLIFVYYTLRELKGKKPVTIRLFD
ncbi:MAG: APC family permease [Candidatus Micrarchaeia archaeon]